MKLAHFSHYLYKCFGIFNVLFILTFSYPYYFLPDMGKKTHFVFEKVVTFLAEQVFYLSKPYTLELISDSTGLYLHCFFLLLISFPLALYRLSKVFGNLAKSIKEFILSFFRYYLSLSLLIYGAAKLFKWQFYLPEPNTLYTPLGDLPKDLLFWSTMGMSHTYTVFSGIVELIPAVLLLFRRTYLLGALISFAVMLNVVMLNISFDISVKIYATFLCWLSLFLCLPYVKGLYSFFIKQETVKVEITPFPINTFPTPLYYLTKCLIIATMLYETFAFYLQTGIYNDDVAPRPPFHGAYKVSTFVATGDTLMPCITDSLRWKNAFFHRKGYFITQNFQDEFQDYEYAVDTTQQLFELTQYDDSLALPIYLSYQQSEDSTLVLQGFMEGDSIYVVLRKQNVAKLPLFQSHFHWTIDE